MGRETQLLVPEVSVPAGGATESSVKTNSLSHLLESSHKNKDIFQCTKCLFPPGSGSSQHPSQTAIQAAPQTGRLLRPRTPGAPLLCIKDKKPLCSGRMCTPKKRGGLGPAPFLSQSGHSPPASWQGPPSWSLILLSSAGLPHYQYFCQSGCP